MCRAGLGRRPDKHRQRIAEGGRGGGGGELETANRCAQIRPWPAPSPLLPSAPLPVCPAPTDLLPRSDVGTPSEVASLTPRHSLPSDSPRAFRDLPRYRPHPCTAQPRVSYAGTQPHSRHPGASGFSSEETVERTRARTGVRGGVPGPLTPCPGSVQAGPGALGWVPGTVTTTGSPGFLLCPLPPLEE